MAGRNSQISRIYALLDMLEQAPQGMSVTEIWERLKDRGHEVGKRTAYRDLEALNHAGFPLFPSEETESASQRWVLQRSARITDYLVLTARELFALFLARSALTPLSSTPFYQDLNQAFLKIEDKLGIKNREYLESLADEVRFEPGPKWGLGLNPDVLETVRACCAERQVITASYKSGGESVARPRRLGPHYLYFAKGSIYLVAEDLEGGGIKVYALPRMVSAEMTDELYESDPVTPEEFFKHSMGVYQGGAPESVELLFSVSVAPFVRERGWHPSQRLVQLSTGEVKLSLNVSLTPELIQWILSFGADARVVSPAQLAIRVADAARAIVAVYVAA